ncbi:MAG: tetratricopeptide repeat protein [Planctomycetota bacterium]|jgi:TolA-binding protein
MRRLAILIVVIVAAAWPGRAGAQGVKTGVTTPDGRTVGMGVVEPEDPKKEIERRKKRFAQVIEEARKLIADQKWRRAGQKLDLARALVTSRKADLPKLRELYGKLQAQARTMLAAADEAYRQQHYGEAIEQYERIVQIFRKLPSADKARAALAAAKDDPNVQAQYEELRADSIDKRIDELIAACAAEADEAESAAGGEAEAIPPPDRAAAIKALPPAEQVLAMDLLERLEKDYPATAAGEKAAEQLEALRADKIFIEAVNSRRFADRADRALKRARIYHVNGMLEKALQYYEQVIADYPGTDAAKTATEAIADVRAKLAEKAADKTDGS